MAIRKWTVRYLAHNRQARPAVVLVPDQFGPDRPSPPLPLVIHPHGRGVAPSATALRWGDLPDRGGFAVICPGGMGRRLPLHSWGYRGQISDLSRMDEIIRRTLPWLRIDRRRIYAVGGSMGGHETLLLLGQYPGLLAGAVAFDSVTNFYRRYYDFARNIRTRGQQAVARFEIQGHRAETRRATSCAAPRTGSSRLRSPASRSRSGGASRTRSSSTRPTSRGTTSTSCASSVHAAVSSR